MEYAIETKQLTKQYHDTKAVNHVDLTIPKGEIFGLIGQNGAGKSTLMKMLSGLIHKSEGEFRLFGNLPQEDGFIFRRVGALIEDAGLYPGMSAYENLKTKSLAYGYDCKNIPELLELCGLSASSKKKVRNFSLGMKQRAGLAMALLGNPELLILDEPMNGLDPQGINDMRRALQRLNKERETTILISSHILEELSKIATSYGILKDGCLMKRLSSLELENQCAEYYHMVVDDVKKAAVILEENCHIKNFKVVEKDTLQIYEAEDPSNIIRALVLQNIKIYEAREQKQDLEAYFLEVCGGEHHVE